MSRVTHSEPGLPMLLKGTVEINEFSFALPLDVFQLVVHTPCL